MRKIKHSNFNVLSIHTANGACFTVKSETEGYTASFSTEQDFHDWLQQHNLQIKKKRSAHEYELDHVQEAYLYELAGAIEIAYFKKPGDVPKKAMFIQSLQCSGVYNCFYMHTSFGSRVYRPEKNK